MSKLSLGDVLKLAKLARLELTDAEAEKLTKDLSSILDYVEQLEKVDVSGLEPTYQVTGLKNVTRADEVVDYGYKAAELLKNVPQTSGPQIKVRRIL